MTIDLYLVKLLVGNERTPGAPLLHVAAAVDAPTGTITGQAEITQAIAPPEDSFGSTTSKAAFARLDSAPQCASSRSGARTGSRSRHR